MGKNLSKIYATISKCSILGSGASDTAYAHPTDKTRVYLVTKDYWKTQVFAEYGLLYALHYGIMGSGKRLYLAEVEHLKTLDEIKGGSDLFAKIQKEASVIRNRLYYEGYTRDAAVKIWRDIRDKPVFYPYHNRLAKVALRYLAANRDNRYSYIVWDVHDGNYLLHGNTVIPTDCVMWG